MADVPVEPPESEPGPWWESTPAGTPVLLAFVKLGSTREWDALSPGDMRRRAQYSAGVEAIASKANAAQPLHWQNDEVMLFIKGDEQQSAVARAFEAAKLLHERMVVDLDMKVRLAVHAAAVEWTPDTSQLAHPGIELCGRLAQDAPVNGIAVTEDVFLALPESERRQLAGLGLMARDELPAYVFPASAASKKDPRAFKSGEDLRLWDAFRRYVSSPEIRKLRYVGFPLQKKQPPSLDIEEVFVPPDAQAHSRAQAFLSGAAHLLSTPAAIQSVLLGATGALVDLDAARGAQEPIAKLVGAHRSLVILGDPGSGKTTVLRWLAVLAAKGPLALAEQVGISERLVPVMVSVGRLAEIRERLPMGSVMDALALYFLQRNLGDESELRSFLSARLQAGECLVLLDGLDEVRGETRQGVLSWLETFCAQYPRNRFVSSARKVGYGGFLLPEGMEVELGPFSNEQVQRYTYAFERACRQWENGGRPDVLGADREAKKLMEALSQNARLRELARNPFLLSALVLIHRAEGQLPRHRVQAYEVFSRALCETWSNARRVVAGEDRTRDIRYEEEAVPILGELALEMHRHHPTGVAPEDFVLQVLSRAIHDREGGELESANRAAKAFLKRAGEDVQILLERGHGSWGFLHLTFQEFFTALGLLSAERFEEECFKHLFDPRWEEILRLGTGYMALIQKRGAATKSLIERVSRHHEKGPRSVLSEVLELQKPLAMLLAMEAGNVLPTPVRAEIWSGFKGWMRTGPFEPFQEVCRELALTDFRPQLQAALRDEFAHGPPQARARAVGMLGKLFGAEASDALSQASKDESLLVRVTAAVPLMTAEPGSRTATLLAFAAEKDVLMRSLGLAGLAGVARDSLRELLVPWNDGQPLSSPGDFFTTTLRFLLDSSEPTGDEAEPVVWFRRSVWRELQALTAESERIATFLVRYGPRHASPSVDEEALAQELAALTGSASFLVRSIAAIAFTDLVVVRKDRLKFQGISELLQSVDPRIRQLAAMMICYCAAKGVEGAGAALVEASRDPEPQVFAVVVIGMMVLKMDMGPLLIPRLDDADTWVRLIAAAFLSSSGDALAVAPLTTLVQSAGNWYEREMFLNALWKSVAKSLGGGVVQPTPA